MTTLFDILLQTARALEALQEGVASAASGGATTLTDAQLVVRGFADDDWFNGGTLLYQSATAANRASRRVSDYTGATGVITLESALAETPALGARYGVMTRRYPREMMVAKVNEAQVELGDVPTVDTASLTTATDQLEYNLPVAAKRDLRQVWLARQLAAPWEWERQLRVRTEPGTGLGAVGVLLFPEQPRAPHKIKLIYLAPHPLVGADADLVSDYVSVDWLSLAAAEKLARWRLEGPGADERDLTALLNNLTLRLAQARRRHPVAMPQSFPVLP
jgi:hypothetical protein